MAKNLAGKTFEVQTFDGERWIAADIQHGRSAALGQAETLLEAGQHYGVRVLAESERSGTEVIFEEMIDSKQGKTIQIVPIDDAPVCRTLEDFYDFEARRAAGRLMREYLDEHVLSALELMFDAGQLMALERDDRLFPMAVQRVAGIQAKATGDKPAERAELIYQTVTEIKQYAREIDAADELAAMIKDKGVDSALRQVKTSVPGKQRKRAMLFGLARYLRGGGDWNSKLELLVALGTEGISDEGREVVDEALAELLDGAVAVVDLLGGQSDLASANQTLIRLAVGRCPTPKNPISCIEAVNNLFARLDLPLARAAIYERVAREIGGIRPLTREGPDRDRDMFVTLIRELVEMAGLEGGPTIAEAMVRRARLVLGTVENLSLNDAISRILDLLPHRAVRLGFLLDLAVSDIGTENQMAVFGFVGRIVSQMSSIMSFLPPGSSTEDLHATVEALKKRLASEGLPESWRNGISEALQSVTEKGAQARPAERPTAYELDAETRRIIAMTPDQEQFNAGETLFEEGDAGDRAYLIKEGEVDILRKVGNEEQIVARLGRGDIFGEMSLIDNQPRMATARVSANAELAVISRENIEARLARVAQSDMVVRRLIDVFVTRIRGEARLHE